MKRVFLYEHLSATGEGTASGDLMAAGLAMREAVASDLLRDGGYDVSARRSVDPGAAAAFVASEARASDYAWVIAPESRGVLGELRRAVGDAAWVGCELGAISLASSKRATLAHLSRAGLTTPLAFVDPHAVRRWVVKPDDGAGAVMTRVHDHLPEARKDLASRREASVLEPWVEGEALSVSLLCDGRGAELLSVNTQVLAIDAAGWVGLTEVVIQGMATNDPRHAVLRDWAGAVWRALPGLRGFVGVDLVWHAWCGPVAIEVNPRVTTAYVGLSAALGRNLASAVLAAHSGAAHVPA